MSIDIFVFLALNRAPNFDAWQRALGMRRPEMHFVERADLAKDSGFLPVSLRGRNTGFYFFRGELAEIAPHYPRVAAARLNNDVVYQLQFGGHDDECVAAMRSAEVLVDDFGGVAFDPQGGDFMTSQQLEAAARECEAFLPR